MYKSTHCFGVSESRNSGSFKNDIQHVYTFAADPDKLVSKVISPHCHLQCIPVPVVSLLQQHLVLAVF